MDHDDAIPGLDTGATIPASVAAQLRREILIGAIPPGSAIKERDHAERLGISRTPLREAVRILAKEGLIVLRPQRSPVVANPTLDEVRDELAVLRIIEHASGKIACESATVADIERVAKLAGAVEAQYDSGDKIDVFNLDMALHSAIVQAGHNAALIRTHREYLQRLWRIRFLSARQRHERDRVLADHRGMAEALARRDATALQACISRHSAAMQTNIEAHFHREAGGDTTSLSGL
ncbi:MAG: GntR family transcriptional regulator [Paracoccus sp. (in: a-proteobacteria)]|nr:GntR family transcriptional regulator [Paracoccus sp. (in: a-proteobacteria)]